MSKMIIMQGLPASGKSTRAEELIREHGNAIRVNKDSLRTMLHFGKWSGKNEGITKDVARAVAAHSLVLGRTTIIDDTNLNEGTLQIWKDLAKSMGAKIQYERMDTSMEECIRRDALRERPVGREVITQMALSSGLYPKPEKGFILCDLDGTLAEMSHRLHFVKGQKNDWKSFFESIPKDTVRIDVLDKLLEYEENGHEILLISARPDTYRDVTEEWLDEALNGYKLYKTLLMRRADDKRPDVEVKQGMYDTYFKNKYPIACVIDDRPSVIRMWRGNGIEVTDVGQGIEF